MTTELFQGNGGHFFLPPSHIPNINTDRVNPKTVIKSITLIGNALLIRKYEGQKCPLNNMVTRANRHRIGSTYDDCSIHFAMKQVFYMDKFDNSKVNPRKLAYEILYKVAEEGDYIDRVSTELCDGLASRDRAFIMRLVRGTVERMIEIDTVIDHFAKTPVRKQKKQIRNILRLAVYQIIYMDSVPDSAAVNEAVKLTRQVRLSQLSGFVNGTLRALCREAGEAENEADRTLTGNHEVGLTRNRYNPLCDIICKGKTKPQMFSIRYSMPPEIVEMWMGCYGEEKTEQILLAFLSEHPLTIRVNEHKISADEIFKLMREMLEATSSCKTGYNTGDYAGSQAGNQAEDQAEYKSGYQLELLADRPVIRITPAINPEILPGYDEGWFYVQNPSAMAPVDHSGIKPGDRIIDVCAAPGGKSIQAALLAGEDGRVVACDISESRAAVIKENITRMQMSNIDVVVRDASIDEPGYHEAFDVVLADLPCSGLGVLSRKPESKYRFSKDEIAKLTALNTRILDTVSAYVRPGGTFVYSTCTINRAENEDITALFLTRHPEFKKIKEEQILPTTDGLDGFYYAVLRKA